MKNFIIDYSSYLFFKVLAPLIRIFPVSFAYFLGARMGDIFYYADFKHRAIAYSNIKVALGNKLAPAQLRKITRNFYRVFGQNLIDILLIPKFNQEFLDEYINIEGLDNVFHAFKKGRGVIIASVHAGSWELSNIISANLGFPFSVLVRELRLPRLNKLLNSYRLEKGCRLIKRRNQTRFLLETLNNNEAIGMTVDQGGKKGALVKFFGRNASMSTGAVRIALKYGVALVPCFFTRVKGAKIKIFVEPPFEIKKTGDQKKDLRENLQRLIMVFEKYIAKYPQEYLWSNKIYKHSDQKNILLLTDDKVGHVRQAQAVARMVSSHYKEQGFDTKIESKEVKFKSRLSRVSLIFNSFFSGKFGCQGCLWCVSKALNKEAYKSLISYSPDVVISCGSNLAGLNYLLARQNLARSIVIMRPSILGVGRFDLVVIPRHDNPLKRKNVVITEGAPNLIDDDYLKEQSQRLRQLSALPAWPAGRSSQLSALSIGLLIGGDAKNFRLQEDTIRTVIKEIKTVSGKFKADILITTSRRTSRKIENMIKQEFKDYDHCKLLIIANERNIPETVGGILGLSEIVIISPESISMISEAVTSKRHVFVFSAKGLGIKHQKFIDNFVKRKYIHLSEPSKLAEKIEDLWLNKKAVHALDDNALIIQAIKKIL
ncbi:MAG: mitochondrial fission ELM1 family protein [Candidatus Omnitrophica bacterium]|nr:mitochondrial fission ELM1 family protein [Candidatus Omnitrophota bacterium]